MYTFCIWMIGSGLFAVFGALAWRSKKAVRFWNISQEIRFAGTGEESGMDSSHHIGSDV